MEETIHGTTMPVLELALTDGESVVSEAGEFSWMSDAVQMQTNTGGAMGGKGIMGAVKRAVGGGSVMMTTYTAQGGPGSIAFAPRCRVTSCRSTLHRGTSSWCTGTASWPRRPASS